MSLGFFMPIPRERHMETLAMRILGQQGKFISVLLLCVFVIGNASAKEIVKRARFIKSIEGDFKGNGTLEKVSLSPIAGEAKIPFYREYKILVQSRGNSVEGKDVFLLNENACGLESIGVSQNSPPLIGVSYAAGIDVWRLILYALDENSLKEVGSIFSDEPSIEIKDADQDGHMEIIAVGRDYGNDPLNDKYIYTYKYDGTRWYLAACYRTKTNTHIPVKDLSAR